MTTTSTYGARRWPGLLTLPFVLAIAPTGSAFAEADDLAPWTCADGAAHEVLIDDDPQPRCEMLFGGLDERELNAGWRSRRISAVESGGLTLDIVHSDARLKRPEVRSVPGMIILETFRTQIEERDCHPDDDAALGDDTVQDQAALDAVSPGSVSPESVSPEAQGREDAAGDDEIVLSEERVALVQLDAPWAGLCGEEPILLREDDAIGASGRVLHISPHGVLAHLSGRLVWLSRMGATPPVFRNTWQSGFSVVTDGSPKKAAPKKPARKARRRRR